ncbi:hypothetical protein MASR1M97_19940 [Candidatus Desulfobacillus denitrificans]
MPTRRRALLVILLLALVGLASLVVALAAGSLPVSAGDLGAALLGDRSTVAAEVVRELRLPRALAAFACGGLLALAGALMQVLLRNPSPIPTCWAFPAAPRSARSAPCSSACRCCW